MRIRTPFRSRALSLLLALFSLVAPPLLHAQRTITSIAQINALTNQQAAAALPVNLEATVTYVRPSQKNLFVMDQDKPSGENAAHACYIRWATDQHLLPGDRIRVTGVTAPSFRPIINAAAVTLLSHGSLPRAPAADFAHLVQAKWDSRRVSVVGEILSATLDDSRPTHGLRLRVHLPGGNIGAIIAHPDQLAAGNLHQLLDAQVRLTGVAGGEFDTKMQMAGVFLSIYDASGLTLLRRLAANPWTLPATPFDEVIGFYRFGNQNQRVRILGTLTYYEPGSLAVLEQQPAGQAQARSILLKTTSILPLHTGASVEATGFPAVSDDTVRLESAQLRPTLSPIAVAPQTIRWDAASIGGHIFDLISMEGVVVGAVHDSRADLLILNSDGHLFSATLRHSSSDLDPAALAHPLSIALGSRIRVTGVCFVESANPWRDRFWFDIRLRSPADVALLRPPSWWTVPHLFFLATILGISMLIAALWASQLNRRLHIKTAALAHQSQEELIRQRTCAALEQQRSRILELISSSIPLTEILSEIQNTVASRLAGAPSWFSLSASHLAAAGTGCPACPTDPEIAFRCLQSPDGVPLGYLLSRPNPVLSTDEDIEAALTVGAGLAELAIETRRLYADLRHRSEYDLLTEIPNRFALERRLNELITRSCSRLKPDLALGVAPTLAPSPSVATEFQTPSHPSTRTEPHPQASSDAQPQPNLQLPAHANLDSCPYPESRLATRPPDEIFGLLYIDLDRFKQVNDRHGHRVGDLYLQAVTRRMQLQLRGSDFLARIGGDEFILLLPSLPSRTVAEEIARRLESCFDAPFVLEGYALQGSASLGLALYPEDGNTAEALQRHADHAMYHHKQSRRQLQPA